MRILTATIFTLGLAAQNALAAPATEVEADRLSGLFKTYLGDVPGAATVAPEGETYVLTIAPLAYLALAESLGGPELAADVQIGEFEFVLTDLGDQKWQVTQDQSWSMSAQVNMPIQLSFSAEQIAFDGIWDERILSFETFTAEMIGFEYTSLTETLGGPIRQEDTQSIAVSRYAGTARMGPNGGVDSAYSANIEGLRQSTELEGIGAPFFLNLTADGYRTEYVTTGTQIAPMLAIIAQGVALVQADDPDFAAAQDSLRDNLTDLMPVFENLTGTVELDNLAVESSFGGGAIQSITGAVDVNGLVADGKYNVTMNLAGLSVYGDDVPPFLLPLIPTDLTLDLRASDFNLAMPTQTLISSFDFLADQPIDDLVLFQTVPQLLPKGFATLGFGPGNITSDSYALDFEGALEVAVTGQTQGQGLFRLTGFDTLTAALADVPPGMAAPAQGPLAMARGLARSDPDGTLVWEVEVNTPRSLKVNGIEMQPQ